MRRTVTAAVAGVVLAGAVGAGAAWAATGDGPGGRLADVLAGLVTNGTIDQEQADAVEKALTDAREEAWQEREERWAERGAEMDALFNDTLGLTEEQVRERIRAGETLREIAGDKADELAAAFQEQLRAHLDEAVADGRMTQEQADAMLQRAQERADAWLDGEAGPMGLGLGRDGHGGPGGPGHHRGGFGMERGGPGMERGDHFGWDEEATTSNAAAITTI